MEKGLIFALVAAVSFAAGMVYVRKAGSQTGESFTGAAVSVFIGLPFFAASVFYSGEWDKLWFISGRDFILLGAGGVVHFVAGRLLSYNAFRLIGANKSGAFIRTAPFYTVIFGVIFLNESFTVFIILGVLCIVGGALLVSTERQSVGEEKQGRVAGAELKGILAALGGAFCWGISPILIKPGVEAIGSPFAGALVSYIASSAVMAFFLFRQQHRQQMAQLRSVSNLTPLVIGGIFVAIGQLLNYTALSYSPASVVTPLLGTHVLFVYLFSFLLNRDIEVFTVKVVLGMLATALGAFLLFW